MEMLDMRGSCGVPLDVVHVPTQPAIFIDASASRPINCATSFNLVFETQMSRVYAVHG
jgi:hypothetical protein